MLDNLTLADRYATLNERLKELEAEVKSIRAQILKSGVEVTVGEFANVRIRLGERANFDVNLAKSFLTAEQLQACDREKTVTHTLVVEAKTAKEG